RLPDSAKVLLMSDGLSPAAVALSADRLREQFEAAWQTGSVPALEDFLTASISSERRELLSDLIRIDMEQRWRRQAHGASPDPVPRLEEYLRRFPEAGDWAEELIADEYL